VGGVYWERAAWSRERMMTMMQTIFINFIIALEIKDI
jgi:hypothetical protein